MQTFLPDNNFYKSLYILDRQRIGKQRIEAFQLVDIIENDKKSWSNHPACLMWKYNLNAIKEYYNTSLIIWEKKGYKNIKLKPLAIYGEIIYPKWLGDERLHKSHRSNLLRKNSEYYSQFGWCESNDLPYFWPTKNGY